VLGIKAVSTAALPFSPLFALLRNLLLLRALLLDRLASRPLRNFLVVLGLLLLCDMLLSVGPLLFFGMLRIGRFLLLLGMWLSDLLLLLLLGVLLSGRLLLLLNVRLLLLLGMLLSVLLLLLLLSMLLSGRFLLMLLSMLLSVRFLLLLLGVLLRGRFLLLLLGVLLSVRLLLLLLGTWLGGRFLLLLLAFLLGRLSLFFRLFLLVVFLFLVCVCESGGSEK
jgi:hypothetical protein